jgi:hypothetical protein
MTTTESLQTVQVQVSEGSRSQGYVLRFQSLFDEGRAYAFPCDDKGLVDLDALSEKARNNYLYARAVIGLEVAMPHVERLLPTPQRTMH